MREGSRLVLGIGIVCACAAALAGSASSAAVPNAVTFAIADDAAQRAFPSELGSAHSVGFGAARAYVGWTDVATRRPAHPRDPADPAYDWAQTDGDMARYGAAGLQVWVVFWRTPAWASGSSDPAVWAANPNDLGDFAYAVAKRYPQVKVFLNWNEPNLKGYANPNTIESYEPMARAVYAAVKAATPSAEVIAGNLGKYRDNGRDPARWAARLRSDGVPMDAFGINPYPAVSAPLSTRSPLTRIDLFDVPALARIAGVPVAVTEFGWSSLQAGTAHQATWTAQAIAVARCTPGLSQFVFWGYHDHPVPAGQTPDPWITFGWLDATGAPKPVYDAGRSALAGTPDCATIGQTAGAPAGWPETNTIPAAPDTAPVCIARTLTVVSGGSVAAAPACSDFDGDPLGYLVATPPSNGTLSQSGAVFTYVANPGFTGMDSFTVSASDGTLVTPATFTVSVTAPVTTPPAATVSGPVTLTTSVVSVGLSCASSTASCVGSLGLSAILNGKSYPLGAQQVTIAPLQKATISIPIPAATRTALRSYAGKTISVTVSFTTTSSDGTQHPATTTLKAAVPR
jgi:GH35 family endo-1,4-beta-xylanase